MCGGRARTKEKGGVVEEPRTVHLGAGSRHREVQTTCLLSRTLEQVLRLRVQDGTFWETFDM